MKPVTLTLGEVVHLLAGCKTSLRRPVLHHIDHGAGRVPVDPTVPGMARILLDDAPLGPEGERLWVREPWQAWTGGGGENDEWDVATAPRKWHTIEYRAAGKSRGPWRKPSCMPRWASRLTLEITRVRVERVQAIDEKGAKAEGIPFDGTYFRGGPHPIKGFPKSFPSARQAFADLWDSIHGRGSWVSNPWVFAYDFTVAKENIDAPRQGAAA